MPTLLSAMMIVACGSDSEEPIENVSANDSVIVQQGLLDAYWTLQTVRGNGGEYRPLPLDATWRLIFNADGRVIGDALCNACSGDWQANDTVLNIANWNEYGAFCTASETIPTVTKEIVARLLSDESVMPRLEAGRLFFDTGEAEQLVFSGRPKQASEPC